MLSAVLARLGWVRTGTCRCGHPQAAHEHYRRGSDCSLCAQVIRVADRAGFPPHAIVPECPRYRTTWRRA